MGKQIASANFERFATCFASDQIQTGAVALFRAKLADELSQALSQHKTRLRARRLMLEFAKLPTLLSDTDWLECEIILTSLQRIKPKRCHEKLGMLARLREASGQSSEHTAFLAMLTEDHAIRLPTFHGYAKTFADLDAPAILGQMGALMEMLSRYGLTVFANSGTLLGLVRDAALLPHDDDIDLAVILKANSQEEAAAEWMGLRDRLGALGLLAGDDMRYSPAIIKLRRIDGVTVDLFPAWFDENDGAHVYPHTKGDLPKSAVLPLVEGPLKGINLPRLPKQMLALNYGANWKIPDPTFRFPWDASTAFFSAFLGALSNKGS